MYKEIPLYINEQMYKKKHYTKSDFFSRNNQYIRY